jgi:hypothetical protein
VNRTERSLSKQMGKIGIPMHLPDRQIRDHGIEDHVRKAVAHEQSAECQLRLGDFIVVVVRASPRVSPGCIVDKCEITT